MIILQIYTCLRDRLMAAMIFVKSLPAAPTNGSPCRSSSNPGPSPTNTSLAAAWPLPKTMWVRLDASLHRWQSPISERIFASGSARKAAGCDHPASFSRLSGEQSKPRWPLAANKRRLQFISSIASKMVCFVIITLKRNDAFESIENVIRFEESIVG